MARTPSWDPFSTLARLDQDFDAMVRRTWGTNRGADPAAGGRPRGATAGYVPAIEMRADGADVVITVELPGVDLDRDVDIEVAEGRLTISGERRDRSEERDQISKVLVRELRYGSFRREFALPEGVTAEHVDAHYDRGLLEVCVREVRKPAQPPQKVAIRSAADNRTVEGHAEPAQTDSPSTVELRLHRWARTSSRPGHRSSRTSRPSQHAG
jgi:HSP20 family protein